MSTPDNRLLVLPRRVQSPRGWTPANPQMRFPDKLTGELLDYAVDFRHGLEAEETISAASVAVTPSQTGGLAETNTDIAGTQVAIWLEDGRADQDYQVMVSITTSGGRTLQAAIMLLVVD